MKRNETPDPLLARWYAGETSETEEMLLRKRFADGDLPAEGPHSAHDDRTIDAVLFAGFRALSTERMPASSLRFTEPSAEPQTVRPKRRAVRLILWKSAAAAAVVIFGILLGLQLRTPYCYINGEAVYDKETALAATECLKSLAALELPERMLEQLLEN